MRLFIATILLLMLGVSSTTAFAVSDSVFAQVLYNDVTLYKTPSKIDTYDNIRFTLNKTYFVKLYSASGDFYYAEYNNTFGYVAKSEVQCVSGIPSKPYITGKTFRVYREDGRFMRTEPSPIGGDATLVKYIPLNTYLTYIATVTGAEVVIERPRTWYYCKYSTDKDYYGYVYADDTDQLGELLPSTERLTYIDPPAFLTGTLDGTISTKRKNYIIFVLALPAVIFTLLLLKGEKILKADTRQRVYKSPKKEVSSF